MMKNGIALPLLVLGGLLGSGAIAQNLPSAPEAQAATPAGGDSGSYSSSALPPDFSQIAARGRAPALPQFGRSVVFVPLPAPPPLQISPPTGEGMVVGGTIGGVVGFNMARGTERPAGAVAGLVLGAIGGALVGHIVNDVHTMRTQRHGHGGPVCPRRRHCCPRPGQPGPDVPPPPDETPANGDRT